MPKLMIGATCYLLLEITAFVLVGQWLGLGVTLLLVLATSALGVFFLRTQGLQTAYRTLGAVQRGQAGRNGPDVLVIFAGFLLFLPGFITDAIGLLLWFPPLRHAIQRRWMRFFMRAAGQHPGSPHSSEGPRTIEGEFERKDDE